VERISLHQRRQSEKIMNTYRDQLNKIEEDLQNIIRERICAFKEKLKYCENCGVIFLEERAGRAKFCSDVCRTELRKKKKKKVKPPPTTATKII